MRALLRPHRVDLLLATALGTVVLCGMLAAARLVNPALFLYRDEFDVWFESDLPRVFANLTDLESTHLRARVHPLFAPVGFGLVQVARSVLGLAPVDAVRLVVAGGSAVSIAGLFGVLRLLGCPRLDALLFSGIAATSAAALFWSSVPETYAFGAASLVPMLGLLLLRRTREIGSSWYVGASALTLSMTVTNWMLGLSAVFVSEPWKRALRITVMAFLVVLALSVAQSAVFSDVGFMLNPIGEIQYARVGAQEGHWRVPLSFFFHSVVMPEIQFAPLARSGLRMLTQGAAPGSGGSWGVLAVALWAALLAVGLAALLFGQADRRLRLALGLTLAGQLGLHMLYGTETFLYALHWVGLLVLLAALGALTRLRPLVLGMAAGLLVCASINNVRQFTEATTAYVRHASPRSVVRHEMSRRPDDPWLRGTGHVVLGVPGSPAEAKAYHEPGGSFSPAVGTFGVSLWVLDGQGRVRTTSDALPLSTLSQRFVWPDDVGIPGIESDTPAYRARWTSERSGRWTLAVERKPGPDQRLAVVIRSVGPAAGPIREVASERGRLTINGTWLVDVEPPPRAVHLGAEGSQGWTTEQAGRAAWHAEDGWGLVRIELSDGSQPSRVVFVDQASPDRMPATRWDVRSGPALMLPDARFSASLQAQSAHLLMGLVEASTRPGDPYYYPGPWLRDAAYVVVALLRLGQAEIARDLARDLAERDFFGGLGSEADSPGLALWALGEVAERARDAGYDQWLWPHVRRKAELIEAMLSTSDTIRRPPSDTVVPLVKEHPYLSVLAEPARDGLIVGRVELQFPLLYVNAVSYRGLLSAAALAERLDETEAAARWRTRADQLARAWDRVFAAAAERRWGWTRADELVRALRAGGATLGESLGWHARLDTVKERVKRSLRQPLELDNGYTYSASLWPARVVGPETRSFREALGRIWHRTRDDAGGLRHPPTYPSFEVAQAHQWLFLGEPARAWATVRWFFDHQASPGLYSWGKGDGEENTFYRWEQVRGWVRPPHVTPDYRTAAGMLMLQLDMLAYADPADGGATLVIGPGIPPEWRRHPMRVTGLQLATGRVDWDWDGREMRVKLSGARPTVRLGPAFPGDARVLVRHDDGPESATSRPGSRPALRRVDQDRVEERAAQTQPFPRRELAVELASNHIADFGIEPAIEE